MSPGGIYLQQGSEGSLQPLVCCGHSAATVSHGKEEKRNQENKSIILKALNDKRSQVKRQDVCTLFLFMEHKV